MSETTSIRVITGPTASGKTHLALELAAKDPSIEIINADAQLLYKGFDIGTAKPTAEERATVRHHLIDILEPSELFSAADYSSKAREIIREIVAKGKQPIVVGGTGFYIDALFFGLVEANIPEHIAQEVRTRVEQEYKEKGFDTYHALLEPIDPVLYEQIARERNPVRLLRAWEFYYATGNALGEARKVKPEPFEFSPQFEVLQVERSELWKRIELRIEEMLLAGWLDEVGHLLKNGVTTDMPAMRAIGYRELAEVVEGKSQLSEAKGKIIIKTRQYAKRQVTWMKKYVTPA